jgi:arylsulfatase A-like enzyme
MPEEKYLSAFKDIEFPYPATLFDDYSGRSKAAKTQEMSILRDMSMSYDLKVDQLKDEEKTDWEKRDWEKAMTRMTPAQKKAWDEAYNEENEAFVKANLQGEELLKWKYQRYIKDYMRCIKSVDDQVGRVIKWLEAEGILDNTIIVYTSDQGFYLGEHGYFDKRFMYEESFRTPLIIRYPKLIKKGVQSQALVQNIDYAATYLNVANITVPQDYQGKSLVPLFKGKIPTDWRKELYYQYYDYPAVHSVRKHYGIRTNRYKLIHFYGPGKGKDKGINLNEWEFYDLKKDKNEMHNLYGVAKYAKIITDLKVRLDKKRAEIKTIE